jgi:HK97 family phage portal protein
MSLSQTWNNLLTRFYTGIYQNFANWQAKNIINNTDYSSIPETQSTYFTCIKVLGETMGKFSCVLFDKTPQGKVKLVDNPLYNLLMYAPNTYMNTFTFWSTLEYHRDRFGNAYALITRDANGIPTSLDIIHPSNIFSIVIEKGIMYYSIKDIGSPVNAENILHFKGISEDGLFGLSPVDALRQQLNMMGSAYTTIENHYKNNIVSPKYIKSTLQSSNPKVLEEQMNKINETNAAPENAGKWTQLPPNTELIQQDLNLVDIQYIESIKFSANQICALFGLSPIVIGDYTASKFNNIEQIQLNFKVNTVQTMTKIYENELNYKLLTSKQRIEGNVIEFDTNLLIEYDANTKLNLMKGLFDKGVLSPNQIAIEFNYPTFPEGDGHYIPTNNYTSIEDLNQNIQDLKNNTNNNGTN